MTADSSLVSYVFWVKNFTHMTDKKNTKITIHHQAGAASPEQLAQMFNGSRQASAQYGINKDGTVVSQMVSEGDRAWTSGSSWNDSQAVTIEVANCSGAPNWEISKGAWDTLIALCADICIRNGIVPNYTGDKTGSLTEHCMFQATACPGPFLHARMKEIERQIKAKMQEMSPAPAPTQLTWYKIQAGAFSKKASATKQANKIKKELGIDCIVIEEGGLFKTQCGAFRSRANAEKCLAQVKTIVPDAFIKEYE